jgi:hypothetical protein
LPSLHISKTEIYAIENHDFLVGCKASAPIKKCFFQFEKSAIEVPEGFKGNFQYIGAGFENGDCGIEIEGSQDMEGIVSCIVQLKGSDQNLTSSGKIMVDTAPGMAILDSTSVDHHVLNFNESQPMQFSCRAKDGKYSKVTLLFGKYLLIFALLFINYFQEMKF